MQDDVVTLRLSDGTEIVCKYVTKSNTEYVLKSPVKVTIDEEENVKAEAFMAGLTNSPFACNINHVVIIAKTQETLTQSYLKLLGES
jgi:hypothetical protein